jgi:hypothetical protein
MVHDLHAADDLWAVQARFETVETANGAGGSLWNKREGEFNLGVRVAEWGADYRYKSTGRPRCHPGRTLVANTELFRRVADRVGFSTAVIVSEASGGLFDTFSLASEVMSAVGWRYALSDTTVHHYFGASYDDRSDRPAKRRADVMERLRKYR